MTMYINNLSDDNVITIEPSPVRDEFHFYVADGWGQGQIYVTLEDLEEIKDQLEEFINEQKADTGQGGPD